MVLLNTERCWSICILTYREIFACIWMYSLSSRSALLCCSMQRSAQRFLTCNHLASYIQSKCVNGILPLSIILVLTQTLQPSCFAPGHQQWSFAVILLQHFHSPLARPYLGGKVPCLLDVVPGMSLYCVVLGCFSPSLAAQC